MFAFSLNIPTPVVVHKDAEVAFPCQDRPCGCKNAQQCWDSCCCFSDAEKMAWARVNNVIPPAWFLEKIAAQPLLASHQANATSQSKKTACCCCHSAPSDAAVAQAPDKSPRKTIAVRTTIQQLLGCQGKQELLKKQIVYILPAAIQPAAEPCRQILPIVSESISSLVITPSIPPS